MVSHLKYTKKSCPLGLECIGISEFWNRAFVPRSSFIFWLAVLNKLKTRNILQKQGIIQSNTCPFCYTKEESTFHLFFICPFSTLCVDKVISCLGLNMTINSIADFFRRVGKLSKIKQLIMTASIKLAISFI